MVREVISKNVVRINDVEFFMDGYLRSNLEICKKAIRNDWDMLMVVDGEEGSGKSTLAFQIAKDLYDDFDIDNVAFTPGEFTEKVLKAKKYSVVVFDEAYSGLSSRNAMTIINKGIIRMLTEIRQKNLFIIIVLPSFFDLDKYVALWRARALIHVYTGPSFKRGFFRFYSRHKKNFLYTAGKKFYNYFATHPDFFGTFPKAIIVDEREYRKRKALAANRIESEERQVKEDTGRMVRLRAIKNIMKDIPHIKTIKLAEIFEVNRRTITRDLEFLRKPMGEVRDNNII